jgi:hypothetical protein
MPSPRSRTPTLAAAGVLAAVTAAACGGGGPPAGDRAPRFGHPTRIDNPYLPITTWRRCEMRGTTADGGRERTVRTVLDRRRPFRHGGGRVEAVVVRDDAYEDGELVERTHDYFAQADDGTVYYLGEHVKNLEDGTVVDTDGTWLYGRDTDRMGVAMPARPRVGSRWRLEDVPGVTTESDRVEETGLRTKVGGRILTDVIRTQEFIQPEGEVEHKLYAAGIGTVAEYPPGGRLVHAGCR